MSEIETDELYSMGQLDAWTPEELKNLEENFLPIRPFLEISQTKNVFLCGRRGTGKSAIAKMLEMHRIQSYTYREAIQGERSEYGTYLDAVSALSAKRGERFLVDIKQSVRRLWMWVLPVKAMQTIVIQTRGKSDQIDSSVTVMADYLNSLPSPLHVDSRIGDLLGNVFDTALALIERDLSKFNIFLVGLTGDASFRAACDALSRHTEQKKALLIFDTLESYKIFNYEMVLGLQGILEAVLVFLTDPAMQHVQVKFFLPTEIFELIFAGFPSKVESRAVFLRWRTPDLISILSKRYCAILSRTESLDSRKIDELRSQIKHAYAVQDGRHLRESFWYSNGFLPRTITNRLGEEEDTFAFIFRHTQRRPRDLITIMQSIVNQARENSEFPRISNLSVINGVHHEEALNRILADALTHEGEFPTSIIDAARSIFYEKHSILTYKELKNFAQQLYNVKPLGESTPDDFLEVLFRCGVIGVVLDQNPVGKELYCKAHFEYLMQSNLPMQDGLLYCVHPVMANIFGMKRLPGRGAIYPMPGQREDDWLEVIAKIK